MTFFDTVLSKHPTLAFSHRVQKSPTNKNKWGKKINVVLLFIRTESEFVRLLIKMLASI